MLTQADDQAAAHAAVAHAFQSMAELSGGEVARSDDLLLYRTPTPDPIVWNGALLLSEGADPASALARADDFFGAHDYGFWVVGSRDAALSELLDRSNAPCIDDAPHMLAPTSAVRPPASSPAIEIVHNSDGREAFVEVAAAAFATIGASPSSWPAVYPDTASVARADVVTVVAIDADRPVAAAMAYLHGSMCELIHVATVPEARRRGYGQAVTAAAVAECRARGAGTAVLQATEDGVGVYRAMGFIEVDRYRLHLRTSGRKADRAPG